MNHLYVGKAVEYNVGSYRVQQGDYKGTIKGLEKGLITVLGIDGTVHHFSEENHLGCNNEYNDKLYEYTIEETKRQLALCLRALDHVKVSTIRAYQDAAIELERALLRKFTDNQS